MKVVDIANEIFIEAGEPTSTTIPAIAFWIRTQVGAINTLLYHSFVLTDDLEIKDEDGTEITPEVVSIIKQLYKVYDLKQQVSLAMNALASDNILEVQDNLGGTSFKRVNRNEMAKTLIQLRKDELATLHQLIGSYRSLKAQPSQVAGDDTIAGNISLYPAYTPLLIRRY